MLTNFRYLFKNTMTISELVFIPFPLAGHLPSMVELAKLLLDREPRLSVSIILMNPSSQSYYDQVTQDSTPRLRFIDIPCDETAKSHVIPNTFLNAFIEYHKTHVKKIVQDIVSSSSARLVGFVVDMFCVPMTDVANELGVPTFTYFASGAATLGTMFYLQDKRDYEGYDATEFADPGLKLSIPSFYYPVPSELLPSPVHMKGDTLKIYLDLAKRFRKSKGIIVNTFLDLERRGMRAIYGSYRCRPQVLPVGPILNLKNPKNNDKSDEIMTWLDDQPENSVVFLCFGSMGTFNEEQVKEIAIALEKSGQRFLWSLRRPPQSNILMDGPEDYESLEKILDEGFLERTSSIGKIIGWAPQMAVLSHPSTGGFVSHCGWNSILESIWCGVPIAAWPIYAEQHLNAFQFVGELGLAAEIKVDYRNGMLVKAEEIVSGINKLMNDGEIRKNVKEMKQKSRSTIVEGGQSYYNVKRLIDLIMIKE
uniref:UDP-glycosyltransferase 71E1-like n=1 Tax=Erigeron canadensis TaxID=72917 RepID=UPI001CB96103|nr:UDP-glycosyltransferase 71E1-like [Erigeron canadensis]